MTVLTDDGYLVDSWSSAAVEELKRPLRQAIDLGVRAVSFVGESIMRDPALASLGAAMTKFGRTHRRRAIRPNFYSDLKGR